MSNSGQRASRRAAWDYLCLYFKTNAKGKTYALRGTLASYIARESGIPAQSVGTYLRFFNESKMVEASGDRVYLPRDVAFAFSVTGHLPGYSRAKRKKN
jgi:hypothetical protein